jgi:hypothetical protein
MYSTRLRCGIASPGCSMIGAVAGFAPRARMAPVVSEGADGADPRVGF